MPKGNYTRPGPAKRLRKQYVDEGKRMGNAMSRDAFGPLRKERPTASVRTRRKAAERPNPTKKKK